MKLNKDWQSQWDSIEIPEDKVAQIIEQEVKKPKKPASWIERGRKYFAQHKRVKNGLILAAVLLVVIAGAAYLDSQSSGDISTTSPVGTSQVGQKEAEDAVPDEATEGKAGTESKDYSSRSFDGVAQVEKNEPNDAAANEAAEGEAEADSKKTADNADKTAFYYTIQKETTTFEKDTKAIQQMTEEAEGYIEKSTIQAMSQTSDLRQGYFILRIPTEKKGPTLEIISELGTTISENVTSTNYSLEYSDNESRIAALETEEKALLEMLGKSDKVADMLTIQERLAEIRTERESLVKSNKLIENQVDYTSITLTINEITKIQKNEKSESTTTKIKNNWQKQLAYWKNVVKNVWIFVASNVVYIGVLGVAAVVGTNVYRKRKAKK